MGSGLARIILWAWIPLCWQPLWGQAPGVRKDATKNPKQNSKIASPQPQIGTEATPFVVETHTRAESKDEAAKAKADKDQTDFVNGWTMRFAGIAALATVFLVWVGWRGVRAANRTLEAIERQAHLMQEQNIEAREANSSSKTFSHGNLRALEAQGMLMARQVDLMQASMTQLINSERAWVVVLKTDPPELLRSPVLIPSYNRFGFTIKNEGKTVAKLMELRGEHHLVHPTYTLPTPPAYKELPPSEHELGFPHGSVLAPGGTIETWISIDDLFDDSTLREVQDGGKILYVYGFLRYFDFAKEERRLQFCFRYVNRGVSWTAESGELTFRAQWMVAGPPDYNTHT
jgi:hypothetical protein